ncbi:MAG: hypothetical protein NVSMB6_13410 [Burkholderiaceae bacterium]
MSRTFRVFPEGEYYNLLLLIDGHESARVRCVSERALTEIGVKWASYAAYATAQGVDNADYSQVTKDNSTARMVGKRLTAYWSKC